MSLADETSGWHLLKGGDFRIRCVEYHENASAGGSIGTGAATALHYDAGSLVTLDVMLSPTSAFDGGEFGCLEADGSMRAHPFEQGDALVFVSHKYHTARPVTRGTREVLVIELWRGPERHCPHRCLDPTGVCTYTNGNANDPASDEELLPSLGLDEAPDDSEDEGDDESSRELQQ